MAAVSGCGRETRPVPPPDPDSAAAAKFADMLRQKVTVDAMMAHLSKLQEIADANDGNRALGTAGYDASVDYVAEDAAGQGLRRANPGVRGASAVRRRARSPSAAQCVEAKPLQFTIGTPPRA